MTKETQAFTVGQALKDGNRLLSGADTDTPHLDASLLLAGAMNTSREILYMNREQEIDPAALNQFQNSLQRRQNGEPVAWILGHKEFWGLEFAVGYGTLCPRADSEILVERALQVMDHRPPGRLHDCCCGPGTVGMALAVERPLWSVSGSDISPFAADFFRRNNHTLTGGRVEFMHSDLMDGIQGGFDVIVSNPPYLTPGETRERVQGGWKEPPLALDGGGPDGLELIRRLIPNAHARLNESGRLLIESAPLQVSAIQEILSSNGFEQIETARDLGGRERVTSARKVS